MGDCLDLEFFIKMAMQLSNSDWRQISECDMVLTIHD